MSSSCPPSRLFSRSLPVLSPSPLCLTRRLFLVRYSAAARTLAGSGVGVSSLAANGQAAAMTQTAVGSHLDVTLDVHRDFLAQVAFDGPFVFEDLADVVDFLFAQIAYLLVKIDPGAEQQRLR